MSTPATPMFVRRFDVYGVTAEIQSDSEELAGNLAEDFAHFNASAPSLTHILLVLHASAPPYSDVPQRAATVYTPRNVSFQDAGRTYIDYSGRALGILDSTSCRFDAYSEDPDLLYEVGYLFLLSQLGERLDARGVHRVHAVGLSVDGRGALAMLPMGGGKSTLCAFLLRHPEVKLLSDDSPLITRDGTLLAFPLRIGLLPGSESGYAPHQLRTVQRMEFGPKQLVNYEHFQHRVAPSAVPKFLFIGKRSLSDECRIEPCSRLRALWALVPNCIIGLGLFQGMEFVFHRGSGELLSKLRIAVSRLRNCMALAWRSETAVLILGRNSEWNAAFMLDYMQRRSAVRPLVMAHRR